MQHFWTHKDPSQLDLPLGSCLATGPGSQLQINSLISVELEVYFARALRPAGLSSSEPVLHRKAKTEAAIRIKAAASSFGHARAIASLTTRVSLRRLISTTISKSDCRRKLTAGLGYLLGPALGNGMFSLTHPKLARGDPPPIDVMDREFYHRIKTRRADPSHQNVNNVVPDFFGEKVS